MTTEKKETVDKGDDKTITKEPTTDAVDAPLATFGEVFSFAETFKTRLYLVIGLFWTVISGLSLPTAIFFFSRAMGEISAIVEEGLDPILYVVYSLMIVGVVALVSETLQSGFLVTASDEMTMNLKRKWFEAVLRQDMAYFDLQDVSGTSTIISTNGAKYKKGVSKKLGSGVQFTCMVLAGFGLAFYSSWKVTLTVLACIPVLAVSTGTLLKLNSTKTARDNAAYAKAGAVVYQTVANIRTILALNAGEEMIQKFEAATKEAYDGAISQLFMLGLANGSFTGGFLMCNMVVTGYGAFLLYDSAVVVVVGVALVVSIGVDATFRRRLWKKMVDRRVNSISRVVVHRNMHSW